MFAVITRRGIVFQATSYDACADWVKSNPSTDWTINEFESSCGWIVVLMD